jgi:hypothetical protein
VRALALALAAAALAGCGTEDRRSAPAASALVLTCDGSTTKVLTSNATAGPEGVTIVVRNTAGRPLSVSAHEPDGSGLGFGAGPGETRDVYDLAPGRLRVACFDSRRGDPSEVPRVAAKVGADPDSWRDDQLRCPSGGRSVLYLDYAAGARGEGDPDRAAATALARQFGKAEEIERVGYLGDTEERRYALLRDGRAVGLAATFRGDEGWLVSRIERCED